ncbi:MAG: glycosyltransferase family 2 protein [Alphaproteobacteria bacterium]|nr:glycosyltransferase family 2 protein [Alphaproteobacteria bacterium]
MKLSIAMPSHNVGSRINANILNACVLGSDDVEIIIRDNSGNEEKRKFLSGIKEKNCRIISVDECPGAENIRELMDETAGEFVFTVCDDDYVNGYALPSLLDEIDKIKGDTAYVGTSGIFVIDEDRKTEFFRFNCFDTPDALGRFKAYLGGCPSIFQYSPIRRTVSKSVLGFCSTLPVYLSYHDWLLNCLHLMHGKFSYVDRYIYHYYNSNWTGGEQNLISDARYFKLAGIDTSGVRIQWLIAAFEGAQTFMSKYSGVDMPREQRQSLAVFCLSHWYQMLFHTYMRQAPDAKYDAETLKIAQKWMASSEINLSNLLADICEFYALTAPEKAQHYYDFWK